MEPLVAQLVVTLNLGCGRFPMADAINLDRIAGPGVNIVHDLDDTPWPFDDDMFTTIHAVQVFEHVDNPVGFMCEAWRVLTVGGDLHLSVPHYLSENSHTDPTHRRHCTLHTWDYWIAGTPLNASNGPVYGGDIHRFEALGIDHIADDIHVTLRKIAASEIP